jgi:hypothetical protein
MGSVEFFFLVILVEEEHLVVPVVWALASSFKVV